MKKNYLYNLSVSVVNVLFPVLSFPYAARMLGPAGIGKVQLATLFAQYFALFAALGIPVYGIQEVAKVRHNKLKLDSVFSELLVIYFATSVLMSLIYLSVIFSSSYFAPNLELYCYAGFIVLLGFSYIDWFYSGIEDFKSLAIRTVVTKLLALIFLYLFVRKPTDYLNYLIITIFSLVANNVFNLLLIRGKVGVRKPTRTILKHLKPLLYIFSTTIASSMYTVMDTVLLGFLSSEKAAGLYTAAIKLTKVMLPFVFSAGAIMVPRISENMHNNRQAEVQEMLGRSFHFIAFFSIPLSLGLYLLAPECIEVFSGSRFYEAVPCMRIISFLPLMIGFGYFFGFQILTPGGKYRAMLISVITGLALCFVLNIWLVPVFSQNGTAIANMISELVVTLLYFFFVRKHFSYTFQWHFIWKAFTCSLVCIPVVYGIRLIIHEPLPVLMVSAILCALSYFALQYLLFRDKVIVSAVGSVVAKLFQKNNR